MKIGIDISQTVHQGGVAVFRSNLVKNLLQIDKQNQYIIYGNSLRKYENLQKMYKKVQNKNSVAKFNKLPPTLSQILFNQLRVPSIEFFTGKVDVFHSSDWTEPKAKAVKVTTVHDLAPFLFPKMHDEKIIQVFKRKLALIKKESKIIIADSKSTKKDLINLFDIKPNRIEVVYGALSEGFKKAEPDFNIVKKLKLDKYIISDAARNPRKNLKNLLKAFKQLKDKDIKLVLIGTPMWAKKETAELLNDANLQKRIVSTGFVCFSELKALYSQAVCAVFPSLYEGFGLPVLEALSMDCPVIVSNVSSLPEVSGNAGIKVDPKNPHSITKGIEKILAISSSSDELNKLKEKGREQLKKFSWEKTAKKTLEIYKKARLINYMNLKI